MSPEPRTRTTASSDISQTCFFSRVPAMQECRRRARPGIPRGLVTYPRILISPPSPTPEHPKSGTAISSERNNKIRCQRAPGKQVVEGNLVETSQSFQATRMCHSHARRRTRRRFQCLRPAERSPFWAHGCWSVGWGGCVGEMTRVDSARLTNLGIVSKRAAAFFPPSVLVTQALCLLITVRPSASALWPAMLQPAVESW